jgi:hypothetical protein
LVQRLNILCDEQLSIFGINFNLCLYILALKLAGCYKWVTVGGGGVGMWLAVAASGGAAAAMAYDAKLCSIMGVGPRRNCLPRHTMLLLATRFDLTL